MVEPGNNRSTDDWAEFRLLRTEYIFILDELTHSKELAEKVVRAFLAEGEYDRITGRRRYRLWMIEALPGPVPSPYKGEFWRSDSELGIECKIDCLNSSARWTGPASEEWRTRFGRQIAEYRITMIWVAHGAMLDFLRGVGLLSEQAQSDETQQELPLAEPIHNSPTVSESSVEPQADIDIAPAVPSPSAEQTPESPESPVPRLQEMRDAGLIKTTRQKTAAKWAYETYPPDGAIPEELRPKDMADSINLWRKRKRKPPLQDEALRRFCGRFLQTYRK